MIPLKCPHALDAHSLDEGGAMAELAEIQFSEVAC